MRPATRIRTDSGRDVRQDGGLQLFPNQRRQYSWVETPSELQGQGFRRDDQDQDQANIPPMPTIPPTLLADARPAATHQPPAGTHRHADQDQHTNPPATHPSQYVSNLTAMEAMRQPDS